MLQSINVVRSAHMKFYIFFRQIMNAFMIFFFFTEKKKKLNVRYHNFASPFSDNKPHSIFQLSNYTGERGRQNEFQV